MPTILNEYRKFRRFAATDEGFEKIEAAWLNSLGRPAGGRWYRPLDRCLSFAIDDRRGTWDFEIGNPGDRDHIYSAIRLIDRLQKKTGEDFIDYQWLTRGYLQNIEGWTHPIVFIPNWNIHPQIKKVERKIVQLGIGLPTSAIMRSRFPELAQRAP